MLVRSNYHQTSPELCFASQLCHWDQLDQLGNSSRIEFKTTWVLLRLTLHLNLAGWQRTLMDSLNSPKFRGAMFNYTFPILPGQPAIPRPRIPRYSKNWECWSQSNSKPWIIMNHHLGYESSTRLFAYPQTQRIVIFFVSHLPLKKCYYVNVCSCPKKCETSLFTRWCTILNLNFL